MGFGQGVGAFLFDWVLRGQHQKGLFEPEGLVADGDLFFLHGFQQRALDLGGRAVDFVGEHEMGEDGAAPGGERAGMRVVNLGADHVGGKHVGRELESGEFGVDTGGE